MPLNEKASSLMMRIRFASGCRGLSRKLRSTVMTAYGTFKAAVRPLLIHDDPSDWSDAGAGTEWPALRQRDRFEYFSRQVIREFDGEKP
jgi:hypothetical protein